MAAEQLSSDERIWSAIRLESTDRVPVVPTLLPEPAAGLTGLWWASTRGKSFRRLLKGPPPHRSMDARLRGSSRGIDPRAAVS